MCPIALNTAFIGDDMVNEASGTLLLKMNSNFYGVSGAVVELDVGDCLSQALLHFMP